MKKINFLTNFAFVGFLLFITAVVGCKREETAIPIAEQEKYSNGFFLINEGWFGQGTGTVSFFDHDNQTLTDSIFVKENPSKNLEPINSTLQFGTVFLDKLYLVTKVSGPVVVADANTLIETNRISPQSGNDWRAFLGIDEHTGLLSASTGLYTINLDNMAVGQSISGITGEVGDMVKAGNYIFVLSRNDGVVILNASDYTIIQKFAGMLVAFAVTADGSVWAAGGRKLLKINASTLAATEIDVPFEVYGSWGSWHPGSITASRTDEAVFLAKNGIYGSAAQEIYKYTGTGSLNSAFIKIPEGKESYGAGIAFDKVKNKLIVTTVQSGFGDNYSKNSLYFYNPDTGSQEFVLDYEGYYFPSVIAFH